MKNTVFPAVLMMCLVMVTDRPAMAEVTYSSSSSTVNAEDMDAYNAQQAIENGYGLTPDDFGLPNQTVGPDGQPLTKEEIEALEQLRNGESDPGFTQQKNDPNKQFYRGSKALQPKYEPPRTHRMYEDTKY